MYTCVAIFICYIALTTAETTSEPGTQVGASQADLFLIRWCAEHSLEVTQRINSERHQIGDQEAVQAQVAAQVALIKEQLVTSMRQQLQILTNESAARDAALKDQLKTTQAARDAALMDLLKVKEESTDRRLLKLETKVDEQQIDIIDINNSTDRRMKMLKNRIEEQQHDVNDVINSTDRRMNTLNSRIEEQQYNVNDVISSTDRRMKALNNKIDEQQHDVNDVTNSVDRRLQELKNELDEQQTAVNDLARVTHSTVSRMQQLKSRIEEQQNDVNDVICSSSQDRNLVSSFILRVVSSSCAKIVEEIPGSLSGVYTLHPNSIFSVTTWCNMTTDGKAWTVIQRRKDGSVNFARSWADYERGFGNPHGEFWIGLKALHILTAAQPSSLRVDLWDFEGGHRYAEYRSFSVGGANDDYRLHVSGYSGNAGDSLTKSHNSRQFTTKDHDNDGVPHNCANTYGGSGGWWFWWCYSSNLNGRYRQDGVSGLHGLAWNQWRNSYSLRATAMMIRPQN